MGEYVYLAVERHYRDLQQAHKRGLFFRPDKAWHIIHFIQDYFFHVKGPLAGTPILLDPWQLFWTACKYGWVKADGTRRFGRAYEEVARKNGKSTWTAPQGAYLFMADGEIGAEVYAVATTREQAMTVFKPAFDNFKRWAKRSPGIARSFNIFNGINQEKITFDSSVFKPLPANADNLDGLNPSAILFDELHAQKDRAVWDVMVSALGARSQPMLSAITTAGFILDGICTEVRGYLISVLKGQRVDDSLFGYVYTLDEGDEPLQEKNWIKANPALGKGKSLEYMRTQARMAAATPGALANFKTKDLNLWVNDAEGWFDLDVWDKGKQAFDPACLRGRRCFGGLDLASTRDLTALALVFPPEYEAEPWHVLVYTWAPQAKIEAQADDAAPYARWRDDGWLIETPGDVTDYTPIKEKILHVMRDFELVELGYDRWNALQLANELLEADVPLVEIPQNTGGMYPGSKKLEELVYSKQHAQGGNPVLRWAAGNVALLYDSNGNYRPDKKKSNVNGRIDPVVAEVMALSCAMRHEKPNQPRITIL
ncbi:terminase TerL endonuclease subunit [Iodobacter sp. CM08]|uniref:terminase large subunit n=1 Tax=Iodobacter sp. CM08 TaxID=3085902 RepID=UPI002980FEC9|nr:terminase TerL endonuclease subunit [Iodobacter sp. CM08]MDW5417735.1 terminase TerL endonuclease subunit [Iodobacter sp. CM08]